MLVDREFDVCELSLASYFIGREQGIALSAIPVVPHRRFRHGFIFVNAAGGLKAPRDLAGRRVGVRRFQNTASVWVRGILADDFGLDRRAVRWFTEGEEELGLALPADLSCTRIGKGQSLDAMLVAGQLDAVIYPEALPSLAGAAGRIARLFPDYKEAEVDYFRRTGIFPPMHCVVFKNEILAEHPWVAASVWQAFRQAKAACYEYLGDQRKSSLAWFGHAWDEQKQVLGADPWPYDLEGNRHALETLRRYMVDDGLITQRPPLDGLFLRAEG
jgi:4,5-dihydroxyphthalate decarboxylase